MKEQAGLQMYARVILFGEILLQDIAKKPNMLMNTAKSEICPVPL